MWKLQTPSKKLIEWYKKTMLDGLYSRIKKIENENPVLEQRIQDILIPNINGTDNKSILEALLISKPVELYQLCDRLMKQIIPNYNKNELQSYFNVKYKKKRSKDEDVLYKKYSSVLNNNTSVNFYRKIKS